MAEHRLCSIPECGNKHFGRGFCRTHHRRWYRHGDALKKAGAANGEALAFMNDVVLPYTGQLCLEWPFAKNRAGYPVFGRSSGTRYLCETLYGPPPTKKYEAAHSCGNPGCISPRHLSWKTHKDNEADKIVHGTQVRGVQAWNAVLTEEKVCEIKVLLRSGYGSTEISRKTGFHKSTIDNIKSGSCWAWVA